MLIAPCTTTIRGLASEVVLEPGHDPVPRQSAVNLDSVESVSVGLLVERLGRLSDARMREIIAGYQRTPETAEELAAAEANAQAMIADEPW